MNETLATITTTATQPVGAYTLPAPVFYVWYVWATVTGRLGRRK